MLCIGFCLILIADNNAASALSANNRQANATKTLNCSGFMRTYHAPVFFGLRPSVDVRAAKLELLTPAGSATGKVGMVQLVDHIIANKPTNSMGKRWAELVDVDRLRTMARELGSLLLNTMRDNSRISWRISIDTNIAELARITDPNSTPDRISTQKIGDALSAIFEKYRPSFKSASYYNDLKKFVTPFFAGLSVHNAGPSINFAVQSDGGDYIINTKMDNGIWIIGKLSSTPSTIRMRGGFGEIIAWMTCSS